MDIPSTVNVRNDTCALLMDICRLFPLTLCSTSCDAKCMYIVLDLSTNELILLKVKEFLKNIKVFISKIEWYAKKHTSNYVHNSTTLSTSNWQLNALTVKRICEDKPIINFSTFFLLIMVFCYQNFSDLLWEKIILVIKKILCNSRLKAENLQKLWDH